MKKAISFDFEGNNYEGSFEGNTNGEIDISVLEGGLQKFNGKLTLKEIYSQISAFDEYSIEEFFSALDDLTKDNIKMIKSDSKYQLDFSFKVLKKEKHLKVEISEVSLSDDDLIKTIMKITEDNEKRLAKLEKEFNELKESKPKKENESKESKPKKEEEEEEDNSFNVANINECLIIDEYKASLYSMLVLKDGRISVAHKENNDRKIPSGINIYSSAYPHKFAMFIKGRCFYQTELRNGNILANGDYHFVEIKLSENNFEILQVINTDIDVGRPFIELSNGVLVNKCRKALYFYENKNNKYSLAHKESIEGTDILLEGKPNEVIYNKYSKSGEKETDLIFYDYENKKEVDTIKISPPNINNIFLKLNSNIVAIVYEKNAVELIDIIKRQIVKKITLFEILDDCDDIKGLSLADSKTMLMHYCHDLRNTVAMYKIKDNDLKFFSKREGISTTGMSIVKKSKEGKLLVTDYYDGKIFVYY